MFTGLHLRNFKSWRDTDELRLAPITAFLGANSSGKTSLVQSLLLARQTTESADRNRVLDLGGPSTLVDLGTYGDIIHAHNYKEPLFLRLAWREDVQFTVRDLVRQARKLSSAIVSSHELAVEAEIDIDRNTARSRRIEYHVGDASFSMRRREDDQYDLASDEYNFVRTPGRAWPLPHPVRFYGFPDQVRAYFQNAGFLSDLELRFEEACRKVRYLGPLREDPQRQYVYSGGSPDDVGRRGEQAVDVLVAARYSGKTVSRGWTRRVPPRRRPAIPVEQLVAEWLEELQLIHSFELESLDDRETVYRVLVRRTARSIPVLITDVGFGVSQVLPVLVLLASADTGDTVVLEQPEIHLHPAVQAGLADVIIESALARGVQVVLETHSEHLLTRLQRRIAERELRRGIVLEPADVALYFCEQREGESHVTELDVDLFGSIANWPPDFFGDPMADAVEMMEARARRRNELSGNQ